MDKTMQAMIFAAKRGGRDLQKYFGTRLALTHKSSPADFYTKADLASERAILQTLRKNFPGYNIFSEEHGASVSGSPKTFTIDPLDGTNNFVLGIPDFAVAIALSENGTTTHAVIYLPILNQMYYATKGKGTYQNGKRLHVNKVASLHAATIGYSCRYGMDHRENQVRSLFTKHKPKRVLSTWCPAMDYCLFAAGKIETMISDNNEVYDYLPGRLIALEAGGKLTSFRGAKVTDERTNTFILSNGTTLHRKLLSITAQLSKVK